MESSRIPFLEEWLLFQRDRDAETISKGKSSDLSAQRIQFNQYLDLQEE